MTESEVRDAAIQLWNTLDFGTGSERGLSISHDALSASYRAAEAITPIPDSRVAPDGRPLDYHAPTVWHAICMLLFAFVKHRLSRFSSGDTHLFETFYGNQPIYRGQSRPWNVVPSAWRYRDKLLENEQRVAALQAYLKEWATSEHDFVFDLFGRIDHLADAQGLAQHYALPTTFVDFTFDPRVAIWFACGQSNSNEPACSPASAHDHAVVYFTSFLKLLNTATLQLRFPHPTARRIYRQSGFFVDYGACPPDVPEFLNYESSWMWLQQNCGRLFFPRTYPQCSLLSDVDGLNILTPDPFYEEVVGFARDRLPADLCGDPEKASMAFWFGIKNKPPWKNKASEPFNLLYTDEEFFSLVAPVEHYLRVAGLIETLEGSSLDPVLIGNIAAMDSRALDALAQVGRLPYCHSPGVPWIVKLIAEALKRASAWSKSRSA